MLHEWDQSVVAHVLVEVLLVWYSLDEYLVARVDYPSPSDSPEENVRISWQ